MTSIYSSIINILPNVKGMTSVIRFYVFYLSCDYQNVTKFCRTIHFGLTKELLLRLSFKVELPTNDLQDISSNYKKMVFHLKNCLLGKYKKFLGGLSFQLFQTDTKISLLGESIRNFFSRLKKFLGQKFICLSEPGR